MITIQATTSNDAWRKTLLTLFNTGSVTDNDKYYRDELTLISITNPSLEPTDPYFPMS